MDLAQIRELLNIVSESEVAEFEFRQDGLEIVVRKAASAAAVALPATPTMVLPAAVPPAAAGLAVEAVAPSAEKASENEIIIRSPIVGTFYRAPSPESPPLVNVGDTVNPGDPLCVIEAMKLMNEIESEVSGVIKRIFVENAEAVEYDQPLFAVERS